MSLAGEAEPGALRLPNVPAPAAKRLALRVSPAAERALRAGHPWLYASAVEQQSHDGQPGDLGVVFDRKRRFLAIGLYDPLSPIRLRVLQHGTPAPIDGDWFAARLAAAAALRAPLQQDPQTTGYRLVHGENDGLPGFVVDRYDRTYVVKLYTTAWVPHLRDLLAALQEQVAPQRLVLRLSRDVAAQPAFLYGLRPGEVLLGPGLKEPVPFRENGLQFAADVVAGQKTGFFFDHRDNRMRVERLAAGKSVLNLFAYTGAFSLYAARGGAASVVSADLSQPALAAALQNFALNQDNGQVAATTHDVLVGDAFQTLKTLQRSRSRFQMVIVDPPTFAHNQGEVPRALAAYRRLVGGALELLPPGGTLVIASCTARIDADTFYTTVRDVAAAAGRPLQEIERTGHPLDHPVTFPEGAYLKCLFAIAP
jgi:23S rRNA (cytosine1962-C5)-methyltransferase